MSKPPKDTAKSSPTIKKKQPKSLLNYDALRISNQKRLVQINNIYIEARLAISGFVHLLEGMKDAAADSVYTIDAPSVRGKQKPISRKNAQIRAILQDRIDFKEYVQSLIFAITLTEDYIAETLMVVLQAYPKKLLISIKGKADTDEGRNPVDLRVILDHGSIDSLIKEKAAQRTHDAIYATPKEYAAYLAKIMDFDLPSEVTNQISEIKATRDIYVHGSGVANEIYIRKAGNLKRAELGARLLVDAEYLEKSVSCMKMLFSSIYKGMRDKHGDSVEVARVLLSNPESRFTSQSVV